MVRFRRLRKQAYAGFSGDTAGRFASEQVSRQTLTWIFIAQGIAILPLFRFLPWWLPLFWLIAIVVRVQVFRGVWPFPSGWVKTLFGLLGIVGLIWSFRARIAVEPMVGLLVLSFVLKLVEVRDRAGVLIILYIGFVAVGAQLILQQSLFISLYAVFSCGVLLAALQSVFRHRQVSTAQQLRDGWKLMLQSIPVMMVLFLILPRLGPLWAVPTARGAGTTGFSDSMSPGDFSSLTESREIVFRATFENGDVPTPAERYWRGLVLESFDGRSWRRRDTRWFSIGYGAEQASYLHSEWQLEAQQGEPLIEENYHRIQGDKRFYHYSILLEPHRYRWLFGMMAPVDARTKKGNILFTSDYRLVTRKPVATRLSYNVISLKNYRANPDLLPAAERDRNLQLPEQGNPRARAQVQSWLAQGLSETQIIEAALRAYQQSFIYTLQPPTLGVDSIDEFLFQTQRGFCEHYASSFVYLMRAAGIPARVVVGYQGGEHNQEGGYLVVRQSDAHAWAEVWLAGQGWLRVDPTAAVAPERIQSSLLDAISDDESALIGGALLRLRAMAVFAKMVLTLEEWDYLWQRHVQGYENDDKEEILKKLFGSSGGWQQGAFLVGGIAALLLLYSAFNLLRHPKKPVYPALKIVNALLHRLERRGVVREPQETLGALARRLRQSDPGLAKNLARVAFLYDEISYQQRTELLPELRQAVSDI